MTNQAMFAEIVEFVSESDSRPYDGKLQVNLICDKWGAGVAAMTTCMATSDGTIAVWLEGSEKWSNAHNLSPRDMGRIYAMILTKWLGWDSTPSGH